MGVYQPIRQEKVTFVILKSYVKVMYLRFVKKKTLIFRQLKTAGTAVLEQLYWLRVKDVEFSGVK